MPQTFDTATIDQLAKRLKEPSWITDLRRAALTQHSTLPWPHKSDDIWRRTDVSLLDPRRGFSPSVPGLLQSVALNESQSAELVSPLGGEQLLVRINGAWVTDDRPGDLTVQDLTEAAKAHPEVIRGAIAANGLTDAEQKLSTLNTAFHHDDLYVQVPANTADRPPLRLVHVLSVSPGQALFPMTIIRVGAGSAVTLIDEYLSLPSGAGGSSQEPHLVNGRIELLIEPDARVHYVRLQRWGAQAREFLLQRATLGQGASLTVANINLGAALSKAHLVTRLTGPHASTRLYGFVFGHGTQHVDQHTLQDHQAPHTHSDLQFRAALQDASRMVYTGLIRIANCAQQSNAYQANHNLLLSQTAHAETIPMLEILADDVQCKHGASIGPIDEEQAFYLMARGLSRTAAERLIVMGFVESIIQQVPFEPLQERLRREIEGGLHHS